MVHISVFNAQRRFSVTLSLKVYWGRFIWFVAWKLPIFAEMLKFSLFYFNLFIALNSFSWSFLLNNISFLILDIEHFRWENTTLYIPILIHSEFFRLLFTLRTLYSYFIFMVPFDVVKRNFWLQMKSWDVQAHVFWKKLDSHLRIRPIG